jgi:hypothetical protein
MTMKMKRSQGVEKEWNGPMKVQCNAHGWKEWKYHSALIL